MNTKVIVGVVTGIVSWWAAFLTIAGVIVYSSPEVLEAGRIAQEQNDYSQFSTATLLLLMVMWAFVNPFAGWLTAYITKSQKYVWIAMAPLLIYAIYAHWFRLWDNLANWYNVAVVVVIPPLMYVGSMLVNLESSGSNSSESAANT